MSQIDSVSRVCSILKSSNNTIRIFIENYPIIFKLHVNRTVIMHALVNIIKLINVVIIRRYNGWV